MAGVLSGRTLIWNLQGVVTEGADLGNNPKSKGIMGQQTLDLRVVV